jgi:iron complex outermembrane recepter protein
MRYVFRTLTTWTVAALIAVGSLSFADVQARSVSYDLDIPAEDLTQALQSFAIASHHRLLYKAEIAAGKTSHVLKGRFTAEEAMELLLSGTGLSYEITGSSVVLVKKQSGAKIGGSEAVRGSATTDSSSGDSVPSVLVAQSSPAAGAPNSGSTGPNAASSNATESPSDANKYGLGEIVVTAQKRSERLQDVPISIIALSAEELAQRNIVNIDDLQFVVPGLQLHKQGQDNAIYLRGVANVSGNSPLVGVYLDEADVTNGPAQLDVDLYDLQRVEVLRGPQGTLYGEGSMGGTIRFITNNPSLSTFQMQADVAGLLTQNGAPSQRIQSVVNVPLVNDTLAIRVATQFDHEGGWINQPAANLTDINDHNIADVRTKVLWQPASEFSASVMAEIHRNNGVMDNGEVVEGNYTQPFGLTTQRRLTTDYDLYNSTLSYDFSGAKLLSTTTYFDQRNIVYNFGYFGEFSPPGKPLYQVYIPQTSTTSHAVDEEVRLTSAGDSPWKWTAGIFYRDYYTLHIQSSYYFSQQGPPLPPPYPGLVDPNTSRSYAVFGDTSYELFGRLTLGVGLRTYHDDQSVPDQTASFHSVDPRFYANLKVTGEANLYASAGKGFRSGGFNAVGQATYDPESVWTYELGVKTSMIEHVVSLDADVFYSKYEGYQTGAALPPTFILETGNVGAAKIKGVEATLLYRPAEEWTLTLNGDRIDAYVTSIGQALPTLIALLPGDNLDYVPRYQATASIERNFVWDTRPIFARVDYNLQGPSTLLARDAGYWYHSESNVIHLLNVNAGIQWNDNLSMGVFAQNLINDRGYTEPDIIEEAANRARPRTVGFNFGVKF